MSDMTLRARLFGEDRSMSKTFQNAGKQADGLNMKVASFGKGAVLALGGAATAIAGVGIAGALMGVKTAAGNEQASIAFTTMLGSGKKAQAFLSDLQAFAAKTPFEFPELQTAASSLISAGINAKKVIPIMTTLGDVTSGMGTGAEGVKRATIALQQMNAAGRITGEDLNQLRDAGIPVYDLLAAATGKSKAEVVKLAQAGKLGQKELSAMMKALENGSGLERFAGLMDKQSHSLSGLWSTFKDTLNMGLAKVVEPLIPLLKDGLGGASIFLASVLPRVAAGLKSVAGWVMGSVIPAAQTMFRWIAGSLWPALQQGYQTILPGVKQALAIVTGGVDGGSVSWKKIGDIITTKVIPVLAAAIRVWLPLIATNIRVVVEDIKAWWRVVSTLISVFKPAFSIIIGLTVSLMRVWAAMLRALGNVPGFEWAKRAADKMQNAADKAAAIKSAIDRIPSEKNVTVNVGARVMTGRIKVGNEHVNVGMRAKGGPVRRGMPYIVGENEPELFVPGATGRVFNSSQVGGGGGVVINVNGATIGTPDGIAREIETALSALRRKQGGRLAFT